MKSVKVAMIDGVIRPHALYGVGVCELPNQVAQDTVMHGSL